MPNRIRGVKLGALALACAAAWVAAALAPAPAQAPLEAVVVASTAPAIAPGAIVRAGQMVAVPEGASVTLLEQSGALVTLTAPGPYQPSGADPARSAGFDPGRLISAVATLVRVDQNDAQMRPFRGGSQRAACQSVAAEGSLLSVPQLLYANCPDAARRRLDHVVARETPPNLFIAEARMTPPADGAPAQVSLVAITNFDARLACAPATPEGAGPALADPVAVVASRPTRLTAPWPSSAAPPGAALVCTAEGGQDSAAKAAATRRIDLE